jgi:hypothetical protein
MPLITISAATVNVVSLGANPEGLKASATKAAFREAFDKHPAATIVVPAGKYLIDNSAGAFVVNNFTGQLQFATGAQLFFTTNTKGGIWFSGGSGARIDGLNVNYQESAPVRVIAQEAIQFIFTTDTLVSNVQSKNGPSAGLLFWQCIRPKVVNATVTSTRADGLHFANCQDPQVFNYTGTDTGDDGLAFLNYKSGPPNSGGYAQNITIRRSKSRGITVIGQSDVTVSGFFVDGTASSGLLCGEDPVYKTAIPSSVIFTSGTVQNAGTITPRAGNQFGIEYNLQNSCTFSQISVSGSWGNGVAGKAPSGRVVLKDIHVLGSTTGGGFGLFQTAKVELNNATAEATLGSGFMFNQCPNVVADGLSAVNTSKGDPLHRAIWFQNGSSVSASNMAIIDSQRSATGFIVGAYQSWGYSQHGTAGPISAQIDHGSLVIENNSITLKISR